MAENNNVKVAGALQTTEQKEVMQLKNSIQNTIMNNIKEMESNGGLVIPKNYCVENQIKLAMMKLSMAVLKNGKPLLQSVTPASVINSLLNMCILGLSCDKFQCNFIPYGNELQLQPTSNGRITLAKRLAGIGDPMAEVIYEGDVFEYTINVKTGKKVILKHEQKLANINNDKIIGVWCMIPFKDESKDPYIEIMTKAEIMRAWMQGQAKGEGSTHKNFPQEMAKKTVIARACKRLVNTSDDSGIIDQIDRRFDSPDYQPQDDAKPIEANFILDSNAEASTTPEPAADTRPAKVEPADDIPAEYDESIFNQQ